jgi:D-3-phosphoglycerate dehydrogenase / 2-oxoglutarate reductase
MKPGAVRVNAARSPLVDDHAVLRGPDSDRLSGHALDAFDREPPEPTTLLLHLRVTATPHLGAFAKTSVCLATSQAAENLLAVLEVR